jgi:hypothetical protein
MELERYTTEEQSDAAFVNSYFIVKFEAIERRILARHEKIKLLHEKIVSNQNLIKSMQDEIS